MTGFGGRLLAKAFDSVTQLPVNSESRSQLRVAADAAVANPGAESCAAIAAVVETDPILASLVLREASVVHPADSVLAAIERIGAAGVRELVGELDAYDGLNPGTPDYVRLELFRIHAAATARLAREVARSAGQAQLTDQIVSAALLHDIGRLVIIELHGDTYGPSWPGETPDERLARERRELGIDHAMVGGVLVRRWGVDRDLATAVERHHASGGDVASQIIRLADAIVHRNEGAPIPGDHLIETAAACGIDEDELRTIVYRSTSGDQTSDKTVIEPCPLSPREMDALRALASGKVYKEIAAELGLSVSTVRTHLHNIYRKVGAADRAQAVLTATSKGWL